MHLQSFRVQQGIKIPYPLYTSKWWLVIASCPVGITDVKQNGSYKFLT